MENKPKMSPLPTHLPTLEEQVLTHWRESDPFAQTQKLSGPEFVFYEGPPTANGLPHVGHVLPRALKDAFCRYQTMRGRRVARKAGWDTHGLPVELEVEKQLGLTGKTQVEAFGLQAFVAKCRESVWRYEAVWRQMTERTGYWLDLDHPYVTCDTNYVESVWWAVKELWHKGLLYKGHKVVPYCPRCGTALSSHEVAQGYKEVADPAAWVRFPLSEPEQLGLPAGTALLAWTTTPWTLPANQALALRADAPYALVALGDGRGPVLVAAALAAGLDGAVLQEVPGERLVGARYRRPFAVGAPGEMAVVLAADWVALNEGTGVVHVAPAFGEEDGALGAAHGLTPYQPVGPDGRYTEGPWEGTFFTDANPLVLAALREAGLLVREAKVEHTHPFCWRCDTRLLHYARSAWFVRTTSLKEELLAANRTVNWYPEHMRDGRFGNFLENVVDWCVTRERYWGTPLPVWTCGCGRVEVVGSVAELRERAGDRLPPGEVDLHRPWVDGVTFACPDCGGSMVREPGVMDVWFDSGSMPFAQHHYPFENQELFARQFPADFICEALDQTRGWFYVLLVMGVALFGQAPYRTVLCTDLILDERGRKMSKRHKAASVETLVNEWGADVLRFYMFAASPAWQPKRLSVESLKEARGTLDTLLNVYNFYALYPASTDAPAPADAAAAGDGLDGWLLSRLQGVTATVAESMASYDATTAARALAAWVDDLSNWYVRRSRRRFWAEGADRRNAAATLRQALLVTARLLAPLTPFTAEALWQRLAPGQSVHLQLFPAADEALRAPDLEARVAVARDVVSRGRAARSSAGVKVRQPLAALVVPAAEYDRLDEGLRSQVAEELNVRRVLPGEALALDTTLTPELQAEGFARELVARVQRLRKEARLAVSDQVELCLDGSPDLLAALNAHRDYVAGETQAAVLRVGAPADAGDGAEGGWAQAAASLDGRRLQLWLRRLA